MLEVSLKVPFELGGFLMIVSEASAFIKRLRWWNPRTFLTLVAELCPGLETGPAKRKLARLASHVIAT